MKHVCRILSVVLACGLGSGSAFGQAQNTKQALDETTSIGDAIKAEDSTAQKGIATAAEAGPAAKANVLPIHLIYVHGMSARGPKESELLRLSICKQLKECTGTLELVSHTYATGPFGPGTVRPTLQYAGHPIWETDEEWVASTPYMDRYLLSGGGHVPIVVDEINWFPIVFAAKCKFLLPVDERLNGIDEGLEGVCRPTTVADGKYFKAFPWKDESIALIGDAKQQQARLVNKTVKLDTLTWGFGDAGLTLGPVSDLLEAAIRQLLAQSFKGLVPGGSEEAGKRCTVFFVTHSLGSYLSLAAMDTAWSKSHLPEDSPFAVTKEQSDAAVAFGEHTTGFYFLANQVALLEMGRVTEPQPSDSTSVGKQPATVPMVAALKNYASLRKGYLEAKFGKTAKLPLPQVVAWSDGNDLLSWYVPQTEGVNVVNLPAHNSAWGIWWLLRWPGDIHANYAKNKKVLRTIFGTK